MSISVGDKFGHWTVIDNTIQYLHWQSGDVEAVLCQCDCHNHTERLVYVKHLQSHHSTSCGCIRNQKHKLSHTKIYQQYYGMRKRCEYSKHKEYDCYGGRGISVCQEWKDSFESFYSWAMKNGFKDGLTIERIDNDKDYCPENCKFITLANQQKNKQNSIFLTYNNQTYGLKEWSKISGIKYGTLLKRYHKNNDPIYILKEFIANENNIAWES